MNLERIKQMLTSDDEEMILLGFKIIENDYRIIDTLLEKYYFKNYPYFTSNTGSIKYISFTGKSNLEDKQEPWKLMIQSDWIEIKGTSEWYLISDTRFKRIYRIDRVPGVKKGG